MKIVDKNRIRLLLTALIFSTLALVGCNQDGDSFMTGPTDGSMNSSNGSVLAKKGGNGGGNSNSGRDIYPISVSRTYQFLSDSNFYQGGTMKFGGNGNQSYFNIEENALTPPKPKKNWGDDVDITMDIEFDSTRNELLFTFGPHGCQFSPGARIRLDYRKLGVDLAKLYYVDDSGAYIPQTPENINQQGKWLMIQVDHFSRYAISAD